MMTKRFLRLPSPAMAVALGALILSVGGNVAAGVLITSGDIRDDTIRSVDVRDGTVRGVDVRGDSLTGEHVDDGSLTGADVRETTLGQVPTAASAGSAQRATNAELLGGKPAGEFVSDGDDAGGDLSGEFSDLQIDAGAIGRDDLGLGSVTREALSSGTSRGCCTISFFEYTVPANACHTRVIQFDEADLGEILLFYSEGRHLPPGIYTRPNFIGKPGEAVLETCNATGADVEVPFGHFFRLRLIANNTTGF